MLSPLAVGFDLLPPCYDANEPRLSVGPLLFIVGPGMVQVNSDWPALNGRSKAAVLSACEMSGVERQAGLTAGVGSRGGRTLDLWLLGRW